MSKLADLKKKSQKNAVSRAVLQNTNQDKRKKSTYENAIKIAKDAKSTKKK